MLSTFKTSTSKASLAVTLGGRPDGRRETAARTFAEQWQLPFLPRPPRAALEELWHLTDALLLFERNDIALRSPSGCLRFSPGMAAMRIKTMPNGNGLDPLIRWGELQSGDHILDCTLGLGADAWMAAHLVGSTGRVVGLERSFPLYALVSEGLKLYLTSPRDGPIEVTYASAEAYLCGQADRAFDCILFDPMFEKPRKSNQAFDRLREFADPSPLTQKMLEEARRVARRWVLVKGGRYSQDLKKLHLTPLPASRSATVVWARLPALAQVQS